MKNVAWLLVIVTAGLFAPAAAALAPGPPLARAVGSSANELLYVADQFSQAIFIYRSPFTARPIATIYNGIANPGQLALDTAGNLYVTNSFTHNVTIYAPGSFTPTETVGHGLFSPAGVAVAPDGTLYVSDFDGWFNVYEPKTHRLRHTVWLPSSNQMGLDASGNLYVMYRRDGADNGVMRYPKHSYKGKALRLENVYALGVSGAGIVGASTFIDSSGSSFALYAPPSYGEVANCSLASGYFGEVALGMAFDPLGKLMVAAIPHQSGYHAQVNIYAYSIGGTSSSCTLVSSIVRLVREPTGVVVGPDNGAWGGRK